MNNTKTWLALRFCAIFIAVSVSYAVAMSLLLWEYEWEVYYLNFRFEWSETALSYLILAALMTLAGCGVAPLCARLVLIIRGTPPSFLASGLTLAAASLVALSFLAVYFGPFGGNIPNTRVRGIFFSEVQFMNFIFFCALPFSIVSAGMMSLVDRVIPRRG